MEKVLIFVSCGQQTEEEKALGLQVKSVVDGFPGFEAYFAESVQELEALSRHVLDGIRRCHGAVFLFQDRGSVKSPDGTDWSHRSSVWVNQELAILAYRQYYESKKRIPILAFADPRVKLEGAMTALIVNARPLGSPGDLADAVKLWLAEAEFGGGSDDLFLRKWSELSESSKKVAAALLDEGGDSVKEFTVRRAVMRLFEMQPEEANFALQEAKPQFISTSLVKLIENMHTGNEMSVHQTWEFQLKRQVAKWFEEGREQ